jgi:oxygen-independent coproporphyrinogen-3 oxidase
VRGLYIHIPFCEKKCSYCDFYSVPGRLEEVEHYVNAVLKEARSYKGLSFQTLYLGGGTPSLLGAEYIKKLIGGLRESLDLGGMVEATIEVNPESTTPEFLSTALYSGINRVSLGVQSLNDCELESVGRVHTAAQAIDAVRLAQNLGFSSISADLIIGLPEQTWGTLSAALNKLVNLGVKHLSIYCLSLEEGTLLAQCPPDNLPSDDQQVELFELAREFLIGQGFIHYEISNFALQGHECLHNLNYWRGGEYLGLGPAAASHLQGCRSRNRHALDAYVENPIGQAEHVETLSGKKKAAEEAMLRLRLLVEGINPGVLSGRFTQDIIETLVSRLDSMVMRRMLEFKNSKYVLPAERILTSNEIFQEIIDIKSSETQTNTTMKCNTMT